MARKIMDEVIRTDDEFPTRFGRDNNTNRIRARFEYIAKSINAAIMFGGKKIHKAAFYRVRIERLTEEEVESGNWKKGKK